MSIPTFENVNQILESSHSLAGAAETHGLICGFICAGRQTDGKSWLEPILGFSDAQSSVQSRDILLNLYNHTYEEINSHEFGFNLLLPTDEQPLTNRAQSLSNWCHGFLTGLGLAGVQIKETELEETQDILFRFADIAKLDYETIEVVEEDERAYYELLEYVRMAVLVVYNELDSHHEGGSAEDISKRLH